MCTYHPRATSTSSETSIRGHKCLTVHHPAIQRTGHRLHNITHTRLSLGLTTPCTVPGPSSCPVSIGNPPTTSVLSPRNLPCHHRQWHRSGSMLEKPKRCSETSCPQTAKHLRCQHPCSYGCWRMQRCLFIQRRPFSQHNRRPHSSDMAQIRRPVTLPSPPFHHSSHPVPFCRSLRAKMTSNATLGPASHR